MMQPLGIQLTKQIYHSPTYEIFYLKLIVVEGCDRIVELQNLSSNFEIFFT